MAAQFHQEHTSAVSQVLTDSLCVQIGFVHTCTVFPKKKSGLARESTVKLRLSNNRCILLCGVTKYNRWGMANVFFHHVLPSHVFFFFSTIYFPASLSSHPFICYLLVIFQSYNVCLSLLFFWTAIPIFFLLLLFHNVGLFPHRRYEAERHLKTFEQISSAPILCMDCPTGYQFSFFFLVNRFSNMLPIVVLFLANMFSNMLSNHISSLIIWGCV